MITPAVRLLSGTRRDGTGVNRGVIYRGVIAKGVNAPGHIYLGVIVPGVMSYIHIYTAWQRVTLGWQGSDDCLPAKRRYLLRVQAAACDEL